MIGLSLNDLLDYTEWERQEWHGFFREHGGQVLGLSAGPHGDGRFQKVGELVRHVFGAEKRYVDRLRGLPLTDVTTIPSDDTEALFRFGQESRKALRELTGDFPGSLWDTPKDFKILDHSVRTTPKKIVIHTLIHETRHWAQIATLLRLNGFVTGFHDFLVSPVMGGANPEVR